MFLFFKAKLYQIVNICRCETFNRVRRAVIYFDFAAVFKYHSAREYDIFSVAVLRFKITVTGYKRL